MIGIENAEEGAAKRYMTLCDEAVFTKTLVDPN